MPVQISVAVNRVIIEIEPAHQTSCASVEINEILLDGPAVCHGTERNNRRIAVPFRLGESFDEALGSIARYRTVKIPITDSILPVDGAESKRNDSFRR